MYGLRKINDGVLLKVESYARTTPYGSRVVYEFTDDESDILWLVNSRVTAEIASESDGEWDSAVFENPLNYFVGEVEVVEVNLVVSSC